MKHPFQDFILNALREAGYKNPKIVKCQTGGYQVVVDEDLYYKNWPLLWKVVREIGFSCGGGGVYYHQISTYPDEKSPALFPANKVFFYFFGSK